MLIDFGVGGFGAVIGWYVYYVNRYRKADVSLSDIVTLIAAIGGGAATSLFGPVAGGTASTSELFGAYGIGLFVGFFGYFIALIALVSKSDNFNSDWFLDGRRKQPQAPWAIPSGAAQTVAPMAVEPATPPSTNIVASGPVHVYGPAAVPLPPTLPPPPGVAAASPSFAAIAPAAATLDPQTVATCASLTLANANDIANLFPGGFIPWFNATLAASAAFRHRGSIPPTAVVAQRFDQFWDQIPVVFNKPAITAIEFAALMSIGIQENAGDLSANPELVGNAGHPGLAYAFDAIPGLKASYNTVNGNISAFQLFQDPDFLAAHGGLPGADGVLASLSPAWSGAVWPDGVPTAVNPAISGFVMQADFYKLRGRGVIQTTGRDDYKDLAAFILNDPAAAADATLAALAATWSGAASGQMDTALLDFCVTISTAAQWDSAFGCAPVLTAAVRRDSDAKGHYLALSHDPAVLGGGTATPGSLYHMARKINAGSYPATVVPMMAALITAIPGAAGGLARQPRLAA